MTEVEALEERIRGLSSDELAEFRSWFAAFDAEAWDRQIEADVESGKLEALAAEAIAAHGRGESREF